MKKLKSLNKLQVAKIILCVLLVCVSCQVLYSFIPTSVSCSDDLIQTGTEVTGKIKTDIAKLALAIFPVAIMVIGFILLFTHNDRKISQLFNVLLIIIGGFILIILASKGVITNALQSIFGNL